jgi:xanthine dehydrogenase large subunit
MIKKSSVRSTIKLKRHGVWRDVELSSPREMLLDRLRLIEGTTGTKEGCNEGDCGACTVVLKRGGNCTAVNSCILLTGQADGAEVVTVEDLSRGGELHPIQQAMVEHHGAQCGFCTPGIVMSLHALQESGKPMHRENIVEALQGNLCRCTGYRPIIDAALEAGTISRAARKPEERFEDDTDVFAGTAERFFAAPASVEKLASLYTKHPDATLISGATDVGLWITKRLDDPAKIIWTGRVAGFGAIQEKSNEFWFGAGATHEQAWPIFTAIDRSFGEIMRRFGSAQVRASGTVGGNIANGSPIGDLAPCLIALGATLHLQHGKKKRSLPLESFFLSYGKQDRKPGEFVIGVSVPKLRAGEAFRAYKLSKRLDEDISSVLVAMKVKLNGNEIAEARIACGGMAGTPSRAPQTEKAMQGLSLNQAETAIEKLGDDFNPLSDMRASSDYRMAGAKALLLRALHEIAMLQISSLQMRKIVDHIASLPQQNIAKAKEKQATSVFQALPHDSAIKHVSGAAIYTDDMREPAGTLHLALGLASIARGKIETLDIEAVKAFPDVVRVITASDIRGKNDCSPVDFDIDPVLADGAIHFHGQVIFLVVAESRDAARRAAKLGKITYAKDKPSVTIEDGISRAEFVQPDYQFKRGEVETSLNQSTRRVQQSLRIGGQEHFYLEGQVALAVPGEDGDMFVFSSTQHPTEVQHVVARVLGVADNAVTTEVRRMGGGFGGKESQASQWAALAALAAQVTGRPCKMRLDRDDDFVTTGKRHDFRADLDIAFDGEGQITAYGAVLNARCGYSADLSGGICDRAMFHADNTYWLPEVSISTKRVRTNTVSNTAFRGFGGPQGMLAIERAMDLIAWSTGKDPLDIRKANFYREGADVTPYGMQVEDNCILELTEELERTSSYRARRKEIAEHNATSPVIKKGLALTPVKFGISFTLTHLNQAGALVHVYSDGSVHLNHGGTEMGQGLYIKVAQVVADEFGLPLDAVKITATTTAKVPNTSPTAASSGTDLNAMAARQAAMTIKTRMAELFATLHQAKASDVRFENGNVLAGSAAMSFKKLAKQCVLNRVSLSSTGFYKTPKVQWDRANAKGRPFLYFAYGAACSEVTIDTTTGEYSVNRVDILHDAGSSLNPAIDIGQIEGGFVQGMGWLTTEELWFDAEGRLRTHAPSTYKIPLASDVPADFRVNLWNRPNSEDTIYRSKAVGEPPVMLAISVFNALADAVHAVSPGKIVALDAPATPEAVFRAIEALRK